MADFLQDILHGLKKRWVDFGDGTHGEKVVAVLHAGTAVMGKTRLVTATGDEVTEDAGDTVKVSSANLDIALSALRDALAGAGAAAKTLADVVTALGGGLPTSLGPSGGLAVEAASIAGAATDCAAPAADTAAVVTYAAAAGTRHVLHAIHCSYDGVPPVGTIQVEDGAGTIVYGPLPITADGLAPINFPRGLKGTVNTAMIVTLAAGGAGISGVLWCQHETEAA